MNIDDYFKNLNIVNGGDLSFEDFYKSKGVYTLRLENGLGKKVSSENIPGAEILKWLRIVDNLNELDYAITLVNVEAGGKC